MPRMGFDHNVVHVGPNRACLYAMLSSADEVGKL